MNNIFEKFPKDPCNSFLAHTNKLKDSPKDKQKQKIKKINCLLNTFSNKKHLLKYRILAFTVFLYYVNIPTPQSYFVYKIDITMTIPCASLRLPSRERNTKLTI